MACPPDVRGLLPRWRPDDKWWRDAKSRRRPGRRGRWPRRGPAEPSPPARGKNGTDGPKGVARKIGRPFSAGLPRAEAGADRASVGYGLRETTTAWRSRARSVVTRRDCGSEQGAGRGPTPRVREARRHSRVQIVTALEGRQGARLPRPVLLTFFTARKHPGRPLRRASTEKEDRTSATVVRSASEGVAIRLHRVRA